MTKKEIARELELLADLMTGGNITDAAVVIRLRNLVKDLDPGAVQMDERLLNGSEDNGIGSTF
jgi:hypothetical protein